MKRLYRCRDVWCHAVFEEPLIMGVPDPLYEGEYKYDPVEICPVCGCDNPVSGGLCGCKGCKNWTDEYDFCEACKIAILEALDELYYRNVTKGDKAAELIFFDILADWIKEMYQ